MCEVITSTSENGFKLIGKYMTRLLIVGSKGILVTIPSPCPAVILWAAHQHGVRCAGVLAKDIVASPWLRSATVLVVSGRQLKLSRNSLDAEEH